MDANILQCYIDAGQVASQVLREAVKYASHKVDVPVLELAQIAEARIIELGGQVAFPCNISINEIASHYTPPVNDSLKLQKGDVVKIDVGAHIDGYIADTAATVEISTNKHTKLIGASKKALRNAISMTCAGTNTKDIGKVIESTINEMGFSPIYDLTGHSLKQYSLHANVNIPNYAASFGNTLLAGNVIAIEPFATYGKGTTRNGDAYIFSLNKRFEKHIHNESNMHSKSLLGDIYKQYRYLPFARRWLEDIVDSNIDNYVATGDIIAYPVLHEISGGIVSQFEHTVIVDESGCIVTT
ncbi:MAG TPA: type II methionyl aminopeptidase [Methanosarcinaceae archaeon]|nr:type II methionyl aminopeptidase [Methanosarcinaceae archaeon]